MGLSVKPITTYPERINNNRSRWEGELTFDAATTGTELWTEPMKFFKSLTNVWFEDTGGYCFDYNTTTRMLAVWEYAGAAWAGGVSLGPIKFHLEGLHT